MAEVVNLRTARKRAARAEREREADANRHRHGRPPAERRAAERNRERDERRLDGHEVERD